MDSLEQVTSLNILSLNAGSSGIKYGLYTATESKTETVFESAEVKKEQEKIDYESATENVFHKVGELLGSDPLGAIGCRVVHGGLNFTKPQIVTDAIVQEIRSLKDLAPLHNEIDSKILEQCRIRFPSVPLVAIFDTAFHHDLPSVARFYALPIKLSEQYELRRYGFHGIAHQYVSEKLLNAIGKKALGTRLITCHLGNGASICAIKDGKSIDTSMGFTPLEGLIMGSRSGDLDPGLILYLLKNSSVSHSEIDRILNQESGLLGLSGVSGDVRVLEKAVAAGNSHAAFALEAFAYRVAKYIGSYFVALGGVDAVAFSGGIGENSDSMRMRISKQIECLGFIVEGNSTINPHAPFTITSSSSPISGWVVQANENALIAAQSFEVLLSKY